MSAHEPDREAHEVDPVIVDVVGQVSNRFGTQGLTDLIALAHEELARAEASLQELASLDPEVTPPAS